MIFASKFKFFFDQNLDFVLGSLLSVRGVPQPPGAESGQVVCDRRTHALMPTMEARDRAYATEMIPDGTSESDMLPNDFTPPARSSARLSMALETISQELGTAITLASVKRDLLTVIATKRASKDLNFGLLNSAWGRIPKVGADMFDEKSFGYKIQFNDAITHAQFGFDDDMKFHQDQKDKWWMFHKKSSHLLPKVIFHCFVLACCTFYGIMALKFTFTWGGANNDPQILSNSCIPILVVARGSALGACIWTTALFLSMNRRLISLIGQFSPTRRKWIAWVFDGSVSFHIHCGWNLIIDGIVHTICHALCTIPKITDREVAEMNRFAKCSNPETPSYLVKGLPFGSIAWPACPFEEKITGLGFIMSWPGLTGLMMLTLILILGHTARKQVEEKFGTKFWGT